MDGEIQNGEASAVGPDSVKSETENGDDSTPANNEDTEMGDSSLVPSDEDEGEDGEEGEEAEGDDDDEGSPENENSPSKLPQEFYSCSRCYPNHRRHSRP